MLSGLINSLASGTNAGQEIAQEIAEFRALKVEIDKVRCVFEFDAKGTITHLNTNTLNALGYSAAELLTQHHRTLLSSTDSADSGQFWSELSRGISHNGQFKMQSKSGKPVWFVGYFAPIMVKGVLTKVVAYLTDTSASQEAIAESQDMAAIMRSVVDSSSSAVMSVDRDFIVTYVNDATRGLFTKNADVFKKAFPNFNPEKILGTCIDVFHRNPEHQRKLLSDPKNLPYTTTIKLGGLHVRLHVTAQYDASGNYVGNALEWRDTTKEMSDAGQLSAINKTMGVIEFDMQGNVLDVNDIFAKVTGYDTKEIVDSHHSMFVEATYKSSLEYKAFWDKLNKGESVDGQFRRFGKGNKEIWLQASYNPILDQNGKPFKVVKYATDISEAKLKEVDSVGKIEALDKVLGAIEFDLTGKITKVNDNFATVTGYSEKEIVGNHHRMFVDSVYASSHDYKAFWDKLGRGEVEAGEYQRFGKGGKEVWLQATYNPIFDLNGKPFKVVKFATDITAQHTAAAALKEAVEQTQLVTSSAQDGDLTQRVSLDGKTGAIKEMCQGVNELLDKMTEVLAQISEAGETINTAAGEISTGNTDLSQRTEQQASSLEETASSMEELAATVKQNAENAKQANQLAAAASQVAVRGGEVVGNVVTTMSDINESARKIEDIISVIDGIAFQTNILALNAAVEAARAGEQGRGFAVVAGEVRNLAQRSSSAAKEIKDLITDSVSKTAEGTKLVESAGSTMQEIVSSVQRVTDIMGEIAAASSEQSAGIDQVNNAITSMDEVTQQNAALVEEAAAAAESLVEQASSLMDTVGAFRLNGGSARQASRSVSQPKAKPSAPAVNRRAPSSPMRNSAPVSKPVVSKAPMKTGTDDAGDWEEF